MDTSKHKRKLKIRKRVIRKLKWGVAGCGHFTEFGFLPAFQLLKKSRLVSVFSNKLERAEYVSSKFNAENGYDNYTDFLQSDIDIVYIGSKNSDHYQQVIQAALAGKHILCEKPLSINFAQAEEMVNACHANGVYLAVNYTHRFHPLTVKAQEIIKKGMLGKIVSVSVNFNANLPPSNNFRFKKSLSGGGALKDIGTHALDLLMFFGGKITNINGFVDNVVYKSEVDDFANAIVKFEKSGYGYFNVSFNSPKAFNRIEILGYKGCMSIEHIIGTKNKAGKLTIDLEGEAKKAFRRRANKQLYLLRSIQKSFLKNELPKITGDDGLVNMKLMEELESNAA